MPASEPTIHEVDFCSQIASEVNILIRQDPTAYPFREARVEGYGVGGGRRSAKTCDSTAPMASCFCAAR